MAWCAGGVLSISDLSEAAELLSSPAVPELPEFMPVLPAAEPAPECRSPELLLLEPLLPAPLP